MTEIINNEKYPEAYSAVTTDNFLREKSSSGGVFPLLAKYVISQDGVVFGAAFDDTFHRVKHIPVTSLDSLSKLQGSKYTQSTLGNSYYDVKKYLEQGRKVLFTGTPCQIAGLRSFLGTDHDNLYLQDVACFGTPSPNVWSEYLGYLEKSYGGTATAVSFREKSPSWRNYSLTVRFDNGKKYSKHHSDDPYMRGFLHGLFLLPSCYSCKHKGLRRSSDITLADLWGAETLCPQMDDDKGTSLIIISTPKGKALFEKISGELKTQKVDIATALKFNPSILHSATPDPNRSKFEEEFTKKEINVLLGQFCKVSMLTKITRKIQKLFKN